MEAIGWQEIVVRLLFTLIIGGATAIEKKWYLTKRSIQTNTMMALGTAMFALLISLNNKTIYSSPLILGVSILCVGIGWQRSGDSLETNHQKTLTRLWCAGAIGSLAGFGLFLPAYVGVLVVIVTNLLFPDSGIDYVDIVSSEINHQDDKKVSALVEGNLSPARSCRCSIDCLEVDEAEVLSTLVKLGQEHHLMLTAISSKNFLGDRQTSEVEMSIDFVSENDSNIIELQPIVAQLKSQLKINSASCTYLPAEIVSENKQINYRVD